MIKRILFIGILVVCSLQARGQIFLSEIQDTVAKGYFPITDYDPVLATYIQKYHLLQSYLEDSISWATVPSIDDQTLSEVLAQGEDGGGYNIFNIDTLGVGTSTPDTELEIVGSSPIFTIRDNATSLTTATSIIRLAESGAADALDNYWQLKTSPTGSNFSFHIGYNGTEYVSIPSSTGNLGIGKTLPAYKLDINGTANVTGFRMTTGASSGYALVSDAVGVGTWTSLASYLDNTDDQAISIDSTALASGNQYYDITLEDGGSSVRVVDTDDQDLSLSVNTLSLTNDATSVDLSGYLDNTDNQQIDNFSISSDILSLEIEDDGQAAQTVDLSPYLDNTDTQDLSIDSSGLSFTISLVDGGFVKFEDSVDDADADATNEYNTNVALVGNDLQVTDGGGTLSTSLAVYLDNTDDQAISIDSTTLSNGDEYYDITLEDGGSSVRVVNTDRQDLSLTANTLSLTNDATTVDLSGYLDNTDAQTLSFVNPNLSISGGNSVDISAIDTDTQLSQEQVEDFAGDMFTGNTETLITSTYDDPTGKVTLTVNDDLSLYDNTTSGFITTSDIWTDSGTQITNTNTRDLLFDGFLFFDESTNRVGISTLTPAEKLEIEGGSLEIARDGTSRTWMGYGDQINTLGAITNVGATDFFMTGAVSNDFIIANRGNGSGEGLKLGRYSGGAFTLDAIFDYQGNIGFGTSTPTSDFSVVGTSDFSDDANFDSNTLFVDASASFVGIGTNVPADQLHLESGDFRMSTSLTNYVEFQQFPFSTTGSQLNIDVVDNGTTGVVASLFRNTSTSGNATFRIFKGDATATINHSLLGNGSSYVVGDSGSFGVGETSPAETLHVDGRVRLNSTTASTTNGTIWWDGSDFYGRKGGANVSLTAVSGGGSDGNGIFTAGNDGSDTPTSMTVGILDSLNFENGLLFIDAVSSEIGVNTKTPGFDLDVTGDIHASGTIRGTTGYIDDNIYHNGDIDTYMAYTSDNIQFQVGGFNMLDMTEVTSLSSVVFNQDGQDVDFRVETVGITDAISLNGANGQLTIGDYGIGANTGTAAYYLGVNSAGLIIEEPVPTDTDDQTLSLVTNTLSIEDGNSVSLASYLDNTDDQTIDVFSITSNTLNLSLESDGEATKTVDLSPYLDNTDDQTIAEVLTSGNNASANGLVNLGNTAIGSATASAALDVVGDTELNGEVSWSKKALGALERTASQVVTNGNTDKIDFETTALHDVGDITVDGTTNDRITIDVTGYYMVTLTSNLNNLAASNDCDLLLYKNGTQISTDEFSEIHHEDAKLATYSQTAILSLSNTDYLEVYLAEGDGTDSATATKTRLTVIRQMGY